MAFNNAPSSYTQGFSLTSTPPAMSSFFATETFFTTSDSVDPTTQLTPTAAVDASNTAGSAAPAAATKSGKTSVNNKSTSTKSSGVASSRSSAASGVFSTSVGSSPTSIVVPTGSTLITSFTPAAASASGGSSSVLSEHKSCSGISCSPGLQAAIAVPVTLIGLGFIIAFIILARRRRRQERSGSAASNGEPRGSKWARHLRVFSFDAELLIGGRSSNAGSIRSHPTARSRPSMTSLRSHQPSVRSLESPAPPYGAALAAGGAQMSERPESQLTAPPPYIANRSSVRPPSRLSALTSHPISRPATAASDPFADPEDDDEPTSPVSRRSMVRPLSSAYHPVQEDDVSIMSGQAGGEMSEAGSSRQAEAARRFSGAR